MTSGIYCYENIINGKKYIGATIDIKKRIRTHEYLFRREEYPREESELLWNDIKKFGRDNFNVYIIEECSIEELENREEYYIKELHSHVTENGYNVLWKGFDRTGISHTERTKEKFKEARKNLGPLSEETKLKISIGTKGKIISDATKEKLRIANLGKKASKESKEKMSISHTGFKHTEESKNKIRESHSGEKGFWFGKKWGTTSIYHGVTLSNKERLYWQATIRDNGKKVNLGTYRTQIDAAKAYDKYVIEHNLPNPLNFPEDYNR